MNADLQKIIQSGSMQACAPLIEAMTDEQIGELEKAVGEYYDAECKRIDEVWKAHAFKTSIFMNREFSKALDGHAEAAKLSVLAVTSEICLVIELVKSERAVANAEK